MDYQVIIWDVENQNISQTFSYSTNFVKMACCDPLGKYFSCLSTDWTLRVFQRNESKGVNFHLKFTLNKYQIDQNATVTFHSEIQLHGFFRKMEWSPDGSFYLAPCGKYEKGGVKTDCAVAFGRMNLVKPVIIFPSKRPVLLVSFSPHPEKLVEEFSLFQSDLKVYFALATDETVTIYSSV